MSRSFSILIMENSVSCALRMQLLLRRRGYQVTIARDGAEGWKKACEYVPHVILLSVNLPLLNGFQVLTRLKSGRSTAHIPVIMLVRSLYDGVIERAIALGAVSYLFKDECLAEEGETGLLASMVNEYLYQGQVIGT